MDRKRLSRNDPCPCGSGKKYKHCCLLKMKKRHSPTRFDRRPRSPTWTASRRSAQNIPIGTVAQCPDLTTRQRPKSPQGDHVTERRADRRAMGGDRYDDEPEDPGEDSSSSSKSMGSSLYRQFEQYGLPARGGQGFPQGEDCRSAHSGRASREATARIDDAEDSTDGFEPVRHRTFLSRSHEP